MHTVQEPRQPTPLSNFLSHQDVACPGCGYNLKGLTSNCCPECRQELTLRVALAEPPFAIWLTALGLNFAAGGFCLIVGLWGLSMNRLNEAWPLVPGTAFAALAGVLLVWKRRFFWRLATAAKLGVVVLTGVVLGTCIFIFFRLI